MGIFDFKLVHPLQNFFNKKGDIYTADDYAAFCNWIKDDRQFDNGLTRKVFANVELKKAMAKAIVRHCLAGGRYNLYFLGKPLVMDARLRSLVKYYMSVALLNDSKLTEDEVNQALCNCNYEKSVYVSKASYLNGWCISDASNEAIVRMQAQDELYQGYRFFVINMLCFTASRFILGMRTDGGPIISTMKYYKGCRPAGIGKDSTGAEWNLIECDTSLSDDHLAILSNALDGDGFIEMCDWISPLDRRIIFRCNY